jgi:hypothetical protein
MVRVQGRMKIVIEALELGQQGRRLSQHVGTHKQHCIDRGVADALDRCERVPPGLGYCSVIKNVLIEVFRARLRLRQLE